MGHQGEPVQDVILRIYRQAFRGNNKREQGEKVGREKNEEMVLQWGGLRKKENGTERKSQNYSKRLSLSDDCDEVLYLFSFIYFNLYFLFFFYSFLFSNPKKK